MKRRIVNKPLTVEMNEKSGLMTLSLSAGERIRFEPPEFMIDGKPCGGKRFRLVRQEAGRSLAHGGSEISFLFTSPEPPGPLLRLFIRTFPGSSFVRFRFALSTARPAALTRCGKEDEIRYTAFSLCGPESAVSELQFGHFEQINHAFQPWLEAKTPDELAEGVLFPGPVCLFTDGKISGLLGYEHGSQLPDTFLRFYAQSGSRTGISLSAVKGNYSEGQALGKNGGWESVWFHAGISSGPDQENLLRAYRMFILREMAEFGGSRTPWVFYNTWNFQERNKYYRKEPYLVSMNQERMMVEIDAAHEMGVDVFVIDTGWFLKTGDWEPDPGRFPDGLGPVRKKLEGLGMKLGLWFNPLMAAKTSTAYQSHQDCAMTRGGKLTHEAPIWETETSVALCPVSRYADFFIETLTRLNRDWGVMYFKWDGIGQYGCDASSHGHGGPEHSAAERSERYSFEMGRSLIRIAEEVSRRCPGAIVDFDMTEAGRFFGLGFLAAGKYFLYNNGPYFHDFDLVPRVKTEPDTVNVFFQPGVARSKVCRSGVRFDKFIPSVLFLTHYLPDPPKKSQRNSLASLVLGGNGIWGDLPSLSAEERRWFKTQLDLYKIVAESVTESYPRIRGFVGSSPEIHEKIVPGDAAGIVVFFTWGGAETDLPWAQDPDGEVQEFVLVTQKIDKTKFGRVEGADRWELTGSGRLKITVLLGHNDARVVFVLPKTDIFPGGERSK